MVVSTGVGGGLIVGGRLVDGGFGNAGHIGHIVIDPEGPACRCGGRGCLEAISRGPATVAWAVEEGWKPQLIRSARCQNSLLMLTRVTDCDCCLPPGRVGRRRWLGFLRRPAGP